MILAVEEFGRGIVRARSPGFPISEREIPILPGLVSVQVCSLFCSGRRSAVRDYDGDSGLGGSGAGWPRTGRAPVPEVCQRAVLRGQDRWSARVSADWECAAVSVQESSR